MTAFWSHLLNHISSSAHRWSPQAMTGGLGRVVFLQRLGLLLKLFLLRSRPFRAPSRKVVAASAWLLIDRCLASPWTATRILSWIQLIVSWDSMWKIFTPKVELRSSRFLSMLRRLDHLLLSLLICSWICWLAARSPFAGRPVVR